MQNHAPESSVQNQLFGHFGLRENPFGGTPDPRFLFHSETHREALASLINGIDCEFGFQVLVAQPGMGKTTLLFNFLEGYRATAYTAFLFQPQLEPHELLQSVLFELGAGSEDTSVRKLSEHINQVLGRAAEEHKRVIVVVDEAQNLEFKVLETLRQLSNFETARTKLMQIVLAGQPQLIKKLAAPEQEQLRQRIASIGRLSPLSQSETRAYINHRLRTAGYRGSELFTPDAVRKIWEGGKGVPRNINTLCFNAMLLGFAGGKHSIDENMLNEATRDLDMSSVMADMYRMEPSLVVSPRNGNGNHKVQAIREIKPSESESVASHGLVAVQSVEQQKAETSPVAIASGNGNANGNAENIPLALVEAIVRISKTLEEQKILLSAKVVAAPEPVPVIAPVATVAVTAPASPAPPLVLSKIAVVAADKPVSPGKAVKPAPTKPAEKAAAASPAGKPMTMDGASAGKPDPTKPLPISGKEAASPLPAKKSETPGGPAEKPATPGPVAEPAQSAGSGGFWPKALALAALTVIITFAVVEKSSWQNQARANGTEASEPAADQSDSASANSAPKESPASSSMGAPTRPLKGSATNSRPSRGSDSDGFDDVTVRKFPDQPASTSVPAADAPDQNTILFEQDSAVITERDRTALEQIADALAKDPQASAILEGHTDDTGPEVYNLELSNRRAVAVREALVNEFNVSSTQLTAIGSGSAAPVQPNSNAAGRAYNRRVAVRFVRLSQ